MPKASFLIHMVLKTYHNFIKPLYIDIRKLFLDTLFPITCVICEAQGQFICKDCRQNFKSVGHQRCLVCQKPTLLGQTHPKCQTPHGADGLICLFDYHDDSLAKCIIQGKYSFLPGVFEILGQLAGDKIFIDYKFLISNSDIALVPMPLAKSRQRWRGFNQSEILCQSLGEQLNLPVNKYLVRKKSTKTQKDLNKDQRLKNVANAFALAAKADVHGIHLILVDDVTTTGATLQEAVKVLKRHGAKTVWCLAVARD